MRAVNWSLLGLVVLSLSLLAGCDCGGDDDDDDDDDSGGDDDDDVDPWDGIEINAIDAPDEYTVIVEFSADPGTEAAEEIEAYEFTSDAGGLEIEEIGYDAASATATLVTAKQKLGISYTLTVGNAAKGPSAEFLSADTALLWAIDFSTPNYDQYQLTADRAAVGTHGVIYIEQGMTADNTSTALEEFDENIFPIETELFCEPGDIDDNNKVLVLGLDGGGYYGGYFSAVNAYTDEQTMQWWDLHSNEMEMVYVNVVDGTFYFKEVIAHEFQHLLYNERHPSQAEYWAYHDEGLAECAAHAIYGRNDQAVGYYQYDPYGYIANGLSLVHWSWGLYENYVQAYLFWTYVASRLDGVPTYGEIFELDDGNPGEADDFLNAALSESFSQVHLQNLIANWAQADSGPYGFGDMLSFDPHATPRVPAGTTSLDLEPFGGAFFKLGTSPISYPGTQGADIVYAGIDSADSVDLAAPFAISGGVLVVYNSDFTWSSWPTQHSGPDLPAVADDKALAAAGAFSPAWLDPPPFHPDRKAALQAWQARTLSRLLED